MTTCLIFSFRNSTSLPPAYNLGIGGGAQGQMTGKMLAGLEEIMLEKKPDAVLVLW